MAIELQHDIELFMRLKQFVDAFMCGSVWLLG